jgi:hypothetical protein
MKQAFFLISILVVIIGCQNDKKKPIATNIISIAHIIDSISFDSIISEYQYIELSHENGFLLGEIDQVFINKNKVYVSSNGVYCFDMQGAPLFKITSKGHARNEFTECTSVSVYEDMIYLYDRQTKLIHRYNSENGSFIDNISVPVIGRDIYRITDEYVVDNLFTTDFYKGDARILTTNDFRKLNGEYLKENRYQQAVKDQVTYCNQSVLFADYDGHSIFRFNKDGCEQYDIQCNDVKMVPQNILEKRGEEDILLDDTYTRGLSMVYENDTHLIGAFRVGTPFDFVYNKRNNKVIAFHSCYSKKYCLRPFNVCGVYNDYFVRFLTSESYEFLKEAYGFGAPLPATHPEYEKQKVLLEHNVDGNPIIALYKFKDF